LAVGKIPPVKHNHSILALVVDLETIWWCSTAKISPIKQQNFLILSNLYCEQIIANRTDPVCQYGHKLLYFKKLYTKGHNYTLCC